MLAGFKTKVFPAIKPGPNLFPAKDSGKFQGVIAPQTPSGLFNISPILAGLWSKFGTEPPLKDFAIPA